MKLSSSLDDFLFETDPNCMDKSELEGWTLQAFYDRIGPLMIQATGRFEKPKQIAAQLCVALGSLGTFTIYISQTTEKLYVENRRAKEALLAILEVN